ncbi:hypothetical protein [Paenibacillus sp. IHBB 10380]|uniref:hypothetical protein n=1 Tax=Paenibacillus sp. IHBB 10380 TaxID=1566358 RepID=UPI0005CFDD3F|nr:hypothetical protein [Paenibacillus sp. IHBB 10380]AJS58618.1 FAD/FMN-containing dehydrogenase [Paenibacillus sp. IHBB 10380]
MKKLWIGLAGLILVMGIGTAGVYATAPEQDNNTNNSKGTYEEMLPYAKQMHPDLTEQEIEDMYTNCHANNGVGNGIGNRQMMNTSASRGGMMNF